MGLEDKGFCLCVVEVCDVFVCILMSEIIESLNVFNVVVIIFYEVVKWWLVRNWLIEEI